MVVARASPPPIHTGSCTRSSTPSHYHISSPHLPPPHLPPHPPPFTPPHPLTHSLTDTPGLRRRPITPRGRRRRRRAPTGRWVGRRVLRRRLRRRCRRGSSTCRRLRPCSKFLFQVHVPSVSHCAVYRATSHCERSEREVVWNQVSLPTSAEAGASWCGSRGRGGATAHNGDGDETKSEGVEFCLGGVRGDE